ncbi:MAG: antibiotic biosynthesis monooxygenase [Chloroflexi bacterium]|nr:antibiotic biosynthesis monooxygenase [Chloroflexota bacterium]|tara:strand:+ start:153 stop:491 length:339 start_codon:yes stop_codon:yes gene_type:complete
MFAVFVTLNIKDGYVEEFQKASFGDSQGSVRDEPGCFRFDILKNVEIPNQFHLYEVYEDEQAFQAHQQTPHYKKWRQTVQPWFEGTSQRVTMDTIFPSDQGWKDQKPCLLNW